jgi:hypothetical protein
MKRVQISIDLKPLERIDQDSETRERGRSAFLRSAAELFLAAKKRRRNVHVIRKSHEGAAEEMLGEIEDIMGARARSRRARGPSHQAGLPIHRASNTRS